MTTEQPDVQMRLYGMMQALMVAVANDHKYEPAPARGVVERQDALDAVIHLAASIDEPAQNGEIPPERAKYMASLLMVIRDFIEPLPPGLDTDGVTDLATRDLAEMVDAIRTAGGGVG
jgi:hypothetical protein